ncbi:MAG: YebC/PmpR family DNA-binding transcriptional regulator [bacterium]|nr:YebC/PmpR family DNA-binding transcriptional regulator [bacterium]
MSGHSKWATIHRSKEVKDVKRGAAFTKLGRAITVAVKEGGGVSDPEQNFKLRLAVDKARQVNMPKENITRAIEKAAGGGGDQLTESLFEGFLPGGAAVLVQVLSDNRLRTAQEVRGILDKGGGTLGGSGSVSYQFRQMGEVIVTAKSGKTIEEQELELIDAGAEDIDQVENKIVIHCQPKSTFEVKEAVEKLGYQVESAELTMHPTSLVSVDELTQARIETLLEKIEDLDDVQKVYTNYA